MAPVHICIALISIYFANNNNRLIQTLLSVLLKSFSWNFSNIIFWVSNWTVLSSELRGRPTLSHVRVRHRIGANSFLNTWIVIRCLYPAGVEVWTFRSSKFGQIYGNSVQLTLFSRRNYQFWKITVTKLNSKKFCLALSSIFDSIWYTFGKYLFL